MSLANIAKNDVRISVIQIDLKSQSYIRHTYTNPRKSNEYNQIYDIFIRTYISFY